VKAIRLSLRMSQHHFAAAYRISLPPLKNWEQGRRVPDGPAAAPEGGHGGRGASMSELRRQVEPAPSRAVSPPFPLPVLVGYGLTPCLIAMPTFSPA